MKKLFIIIGIIVIITISIIYKTQVGNTIEVEVSEVTLGKVSKYIEETGTIKSHSQRTVYSNTSGEIRTIHVTEGNLVKKGDLLAEINPEKMLLEIKALESEIEGLKADYKEAIKPVDAEKISKAKSNVYNAKIELDEAKRDLNSNTKLYEQGVLSYNTYQESVKDVSIKKNLLNIAENELTLIEKAVSKNIESKYEAQIETLLYKKEILEKEKDDLFIKSPVDALITDVFIKNGSYVQPGVELIEMGKNDDLYLEVDVLASEISEIDQDGLVFVESEDLDIKKIKGNVKKIFPKAFSKVSDLGIEQKRVRVDVAFSKVQNLKIGYEVDAKFEVQTKDKILNIPENAVFEMDHEKYVFIAENNKALLRKIKTGLEGEENIEIISGLKKGDKVILSPNEGLKNGSSIKITNDY